MRADQLDALERQAKRLQHLADVVTTAVYQAPAALKRLRVDLEPDRPDKRSMDDLLLSVAHDIASSASVVGGFVLIERRRMRGGD